MAEDKDQKTHAPTEKRLEDAREKGDVASAPEMRHAAMFAGMIAGLVLVGSYSVSRLGTVLTGLWGRADDISLAPDAAQGMIATLMLAVAEALAPLFGTLILFALLGAALQARPRIVMSRIAPKWSKVSPVAGAKRLFGGRAMVEFGKTLIKLVAVAVIGGAVLKPLLPGFESMVGLDAMTMGVLTMGIVLAMLKSVAILVGALALFDAGYQRFAWIKRLRMSRKELQDEHKQQEGDPKIKAKIRQIGMQRARRRMMADVPKASVVITNPTHYAVALRYEHGQMGAPLVVAKGTDAVAQRIREVAAEAGVPLVENRPLARALYAGAEIGRPIPVEHYAAVAEVIGYVLRLAKQHGGG